MPDERTRVVIVGGSLVGLSTALFLRHHGVDVVLVERHPSTSIQPRTPGYNARTMESFRAVGIEDEVRAAGPWTLTGSGLLWAESLSSPNWHWIEHPSMHAPTEGFSEVSPSEMAVLAQDELEPVLRARAESLGGELRFATELVSFDPDDEGVTVEVTDRRTGERSSIRAEYLIAADGADSPVREELGIVRDGPGVLGHQVGIVVRTDLSEVLDGRSFAISMVTNQQVSGMVRVVGDLMILNVEYDPAGGTVSEQFPEHRCVELARAAAGVPDLPVEILDAQQWTMRAAVARRFVHGRVFLAGDAAHVMPPSGALGANTGIQDGWNLAWKLALVLDGRAGADLLETYGAERRPVAELTVDQALARGDAWFGDGEASTELIDDLTLMFGYRYDSAAVLAESGAGAEVEDPRRPSWAPGTRVPHAWLDGDRDESTVDACASGFALLTGGDDAWSRASAELERRIGLPMTVRSVDPGTRASWGIEPSGAVLVRPDGFVAWRCAAMPENPADALESVLDRILARTS